MNNPEIIVIGAGVFGLSTAYNLSLNGYEVLLIDKSSPGSEASGKAMGRLDPILGGVGSFQDLVDGYNTNNEIALAAANIFHFTEQSVLNAKKFMLKNNINVRI